jgi:uncharacterized protein YukE
MPEQRRRPELNDDDLQYDYQSMDHAYEEMLRVNNQIYNTAGDMDKVALNLLEGMAGAVIDGYQDRYTKLVNHVNEANDYLHNTAIGLQAGFDAMHHADIKLGDGFG